MIGILRDALKEWSQDNQTRIAFFTGAGSKAFCAGGDVRAIYHGKNGDGDAEAPKEFFWQEYIVDYGIARMKPF